jgi:5-methylcytosine-specific restriction endonuclease McrA
MTRRWRTLRAQVLMEEATCWLCGGPNPDSVDHVIPVSVAPELEYVRENLRACHLRENRQRGNRPAPAPMRLDTSRQW